LENAGRERETENNCWSETRSGGFRHVEDGLALADELQEFYRCFLLAGRSRISQPTEWATRSFSSTQAGWQAYPDVAVAPAKALMVESPHASIHRD
jgi:hypothetical protein